MSAADLLDHPFGADYAKRLPARESAGTLLGGLREQARAVFGSVGLPGPKREEWRFTPLRALAKVPFEPASPDAVLAAIPREVPSIPGARRIVLVNGGWRRDLSDKDFGGANIGDLHALFARKVTPERNILGRLALAAESPLVALNASYMSDGLDIHVPAGTTVANALHVISLAVPGTRPAAFHPRILIVLEDGAQLTVFETHIALGGEASFANPVTEISLAKAAHLNRYVHVEGTENAFHLATTAVTLDQAARMEAFHAGFGGTTTRQEINVAMRGPGADLRLSGVYALEGASHHDFTTTVDHHIGGCRSNQVFKGVVDGHSHGVYQGRIHVARDAQKTDARQVHKALFLARGAEIDCKPELEIYADDVQCAHGAATGELDPDHLFYFAARGLDPDTARLLLVEGFLADALAEVSDERARAMFEAQIRVWLARKTRAAS